MSESERFIRGFSEMMGAGQTPQDEAEGRQPADAPPSDDQPETEHAPSNPNIGELAALNNSAKRERDRQFIELIHPTPKKDGR
jgi:hypothetical protein